MQQNSWILFIIIILTLILDALIGWLSAVFCGIIAGILIRRTRNALWIAFSGVGFAWLLMSLIPALWVPAILLSHKLIQLFGLSSEYFPLLFLFTAFTGGLLACLGATVSSSFVNIFPSQKE
jgi:hypothetical protein